MAIIVQNIDCYYPLLMTMPTSMWVPIVNNPIHKAITRQSKIYLQIGYYLNLKSNMLVAKQMVQYINEPCLTPTMH
jgi:hypothetical protein